MRVYYAAVEQVVAATDKREVWGAVSLVDYNPRDREGYIFGYKDMSETMGPCECDCPDAILDLVTPTDHQYADEWRARCRDNTAERRARCATPTPRAGHTIIFDTPLSFSDGQQMTDSMSSPIPPPRNHRTVLYRALGSGSLYRISNVKHKNHQLL